MARDSRRPEWGRVLVDGISEERTGMVRPLVRSVPLFGGWGPKVW
jgi:hypothetical protein